MLKKVFNYLAGNPKHQYTLGSIVSSGDPSTPPLTVELNRAGRFLERAVTLTGVFFGVAAFVAAPAVAAIPALVGIASLSKGAGFATGFLADIGARRAAGQ